MSDLSDLLLPEAIIPNCKAAGRKAAILELASAIAGATGLDRRAISNAVLDREKLGSTGVGEGVAIPHARIEGLDKPVGAYARLETPVDFDAIDDRPCDLVFMLVAPAEAGADHLRALAKVSRNLRQEPTRKALRSALSVEAVMAVLCNAQATDAA